MAQKIPRKFAGGGEYEIHIYVPVRYMYCSFVAIAHVWVFCFVLCGDALNPGRLPASRAPYQRGVVALYNITERWAQERASGAGVRRCVP